MPLAVYTKEDTAQKIKQKKRKTRTFFGAICAVGIIAVVFAAGPFIIWQTRTLPKLTAKIDQAPIPQNSVLSEKTIQSNVEVVQDSDGFSYFTTNLKPQESRPKEFKLSIPKLEIKDAKVRVDSLTFNENLALFPGTALPGEVGNAFITGHSVLPQFADPKNYRAIFTELSELEIGDDVFVQRENQTFHYVVQYSKVVDPKDLSVLAPISQNGQNLTLMTCVPPGSATKRLVVITSLI